MRQNNDEEMANVTQTAAADNLNGGSTGNISYGKFRDLSTLLNAYNSLEAEFTRRSQRIKELLGENKALKEQILEYEKIPSPCEGGIITVEEFIEKYPECRCYSEKLSELIASDENGNAEKAFMTYLIDKAKETESKLSDKDFLVSLIERNSELKAAIIREYLKGVKRSNFAIPTIGENGNGITVPPYRPKSIAEAAVMAENMINRKKEIM